MGSNVEVRKLKQFLKKNNWNFVRVKKHEVWIYKDIEKIIINTHRSKGQGVAENTLKDIAKIMNISKKELIEKIKQ